jgi:hypothetical protein
MVDNGGVGQGRPCRIQEAVGVRTFFETYLCGLPPLDLAAPPGATTLFDVGDVSPPLEAARRRHVGRRAVSVLP